MFIYNSIIYYTFFFFESLPSAFNTNILRELNEWQSLVRRPCICELQTKVVIFCFAHAGVIYLKNMVTQFWSEGDNTNNEAPANNIPEEDRQFIRDNIVEAIIQSPERIR